MFQQEVKDPILQISKAAFGASVEMLQFLLDFKPEEEGGLVDAIGASVQSCERSALKLAYSMPYAASRGSAREKYRRLGSLLCDACKALYNAALEIYTADPGSIPQPLVYFAKEAAECCGAIDRVLRSAQQLDRPELVSAVVIGMDTVYDEAREYYARRCRELFAVPDFDGEFLRRACLYLFDCIASCRSAIHLFRSLL